MCGILGFQSAKQILSAQEFETALNRMQRRGPDASRIYRAKNTILGHNRLSIVDLSEAAHQPMISASGKHVIIFNGEIYNYKELAVKYNIVQNTHSDTELVIELFERKGETMLSELNGMFAFAVLNTEKGDLFLARDRMGIKPLFYYYHQGTLAFASELKSLVSMPFLHNTLQMNNDAIAPYLHLGYIPTPQTIYRNIYKFPQGHFAWIRNESMKLNSWWNLPVLSKNDIISDETEAINRLQDLLVQSVRCRMMCDVPFGTLLSGGTDSTLISALAARENAGKINTYTIGFGETSFNEAQYAKEVAGFLGTQHHEYYVTEKDALDKVTEITGLYDEPFADSSAIPTLLVSQMAAKEVKMVLSGDGGDELFHGYGAYRWASRLHPTLVKSTQNTMAAILERGNNRMKRVAGLVRKPMLGSLESHLFSQEQYFFSQQEILQMLENPDEYKGFMYTPAVYSRKLGAAENQSVFDMLFYLPDDLLVKVDRASMNHSLEVRVPLLDYQIVTFALNLDENLKINGKVQKYLLKKLLYELVPSKLLDRPKKGFSVPMDKWLKGPLKEMKESLLSRESLLVTGIFRENEIRNLLARYHKGETYLYNRVWNLMVLQKFLLENKN